MGRSACGRMSLRHGRANRRALRCTRVRCRSFRARQHMQPPPALWQHGAMLRTALLVRHRGRRATKSPAIGPTERSMAWTAAALRGGRFQSPGSCPLGANDAILGRARASLTAGQGLRRPKHSSHSRSTDYRWRRETPRLGPEDRLSPRHNHHLHLVFVEHYPRVIRPEHLISNPVPTKQVFIEAHIGQEVDRRGLEP